MHRRRKQFIQTKNIRNFNNIHRLLLGNRNTSPNLHSAKMRSTRLIDFLLTALEVLLSFEEKSRRTKFMCHMVIKLSSNA